MTAPGPNHLPVVVGVGQLRGNRDRTLSAAREPAELIVDAIRLAAADSGVGDAVLAAVDGVDVVRVMTWDYDELPKLVAHAVGATPVRAEQSDIGGNQPVQLLDAAAARVAAGEERVVLLCGGEARASLATFHRAGTEPDWSRAPGGAVEVPGHRYASALAIRYGIQVPVRGYAFYENALRASLGESHSDAQRWSAELLARFSEVAADNDAAWDPVVRTAAEIAGVTPTNRMVCFPYTLRMVAQPTVDLAAAVLVTTLAFAHQLGVDDDRIVHVWGGAGAADAKDLLARPSYARSPALETALGCTLRRASVTASDLDVADLYSCFPVVPKLAAAALCLPTSIPWTVTGGLNAFGAPANNYSMHAVVGAVNAIRNGAALGLVYGNGEVVTKHHAVLLARRPHDDGYVGDPVPQPPPAVGHPPIAEHASGPMTVETFTVEHARDGEPERGYVIGRTTPGERFVAHVDDAASLDALVDTTIESVGRAGRVTVGSDGLNRAVVDPPRP